MTPPAESSIPQTKPRGRGPNKFRPAKTHISFRIEKELRETLQQLYGADWRKHLNKYIRKGLI